MAANRTLCWDSPVEKVEWRRQGTSSITARMEDTEDGKCNIKWSQARSCCPLLLPTAWKGARAGWGQGQALETQLIIGYRSLSPPARQTARTKDAAVIQQET